LEPSIASLQNRHAAINFVAIPLTSTRLATKWLIVFWSTTTSKKYCIIQNTLRALMTLLSHHMVTTDHGSAPPQTSAWPCNCVSQGSSLTIYWFYTMVVVHTATMLWAPRNSHPRAPAWRQSPIGLADASCQQSSWKIHVEWRPQDTCLVLILGR
jgi:hypothetical protein